MIQILKKIWKLLSQKEKFKTILLIFMMLISSCMELLGIGLLMPVIALLSKPELIEQNKYLKIIYDFINPDSTNGFLIILCISLIVLYILKNIFLSFQVYYQSQFIMKKGAKIANKLFSNYINAPYNYHLTHNSGYLMGNVGMATVFSQSVLMPLMILTTEIFVVIFILGALLFFSPFITLGLISFLSIVSCVVYFILKNKNYELGKIMLRENLKMSKYALQGLKAIKESKVRNRENFFANEYCTHRNIANSVNAKITFINNIPRFLIETIVIVMGLSVLLFLLLSGTAIGSVILILSLFATSAIRLMPSMTRMQYALNTIKQYLHTFDSLYDDVEGFKTENKSHSNDKLKFENKIKIENLSFAYDNTEENVINNFSLEIKKNSSVAFVGQTGCGKTTMVDLILGLLKPQKGIIKIDGIDVEKDLVNWQKMIGYVPQSIFLLDDTVKSNVAFGEKTENIDDDKIIECLKMAQIYDFIKDLSNNINHIVGENGIQLSGGQRQRIGIARALYHNPQVLILDEATSALDNNTEKAFIDALNNLKGKLTIIMIAHRLSTVENCDEIINLQIIK